MLRYAVLILLSALFTGHISKQTVHLIGRISEPTENTSEKDSISPGEKPLIDTLMLQINFCGDEVPLKEPYVARRYHNAVKHFSHPAYKEYKKQVSADLKVISRILKQYNLPADLKYIPLVESNFTSYAVSPKGAVGYWQLMPQTAIALGLRVDDITDERTDLVKSTHAAAKYLKWLYGELGDWTLAAAAYNSGPGKLIRQMEAQKKNNFYQLRLNNETSRYVYKIVAVKELFNAPDRSNTWMNEDFLASLSEYQRSQTAPDPELLPRKSTVAQSQL